MEVDWLFWVVAFCFFVPMHVGIPVLYVLLASGPEAMRARLVVLLSIGICSAVLGFSIAMATWPHSQSVAAAVIVLTLLFPWLEIVWQRRRH
tara:strand:+ start:440841 stop:441116 length:276 start_codon:yes stop_codon:yes gene_type:complete